MFERFCWSVTNDRVRNEDVGGIAGIEMELASRADQEY